MIFMIAVVVLVVLNAVLPQVFILTLQEDVIEREQMRNRQVMSQLDLILGMVDGIGRSIRLDRNLENLIRTEYSDTDPPSSLFDSSPQEDLQKYVINSSGKLISIILHMDDDRIYASSELSLEEKNLLQQDWYQNFRKSGMEKGYSGTFSVDYRSADGRGQGKETVFAIAMPYLGPQGSHGSILLICSLAPLIQTVTYSLEIADIPFLLLDQTPNSLFYSSSQADPQQFGDLKNALQKDEPGRSHIWKTANGYLLIEDSRYGDLRLVTETTWEMLLSPYRNLIRFTSFVTLMAVLLVFGLLTPGVIQMLKPLRQLSDSMQKVAQGNFTEELKVTSHDEVQELATSFNIMAKQLQEYFIRLQKKEEEKEQLRLNLIVAQISPHFIYNTMNTITYLARKGRIEDVILVNRMLIGILRDRLRISDIHLHCPVSEEIRMIEQYAVIQTYRYGKVFQIVWEVPEELKEALIPKYLIQPLVENALFHGLLPNKEENGNVVGGTIWIKISQEENQTIISISDDGRGMSDEQLQKLNEMIASDQPIENGRNIGLRNVATRLRMLYGDSAQASVSCQGGITTVKLQYCMQN